MIVDYQSEMKRVAVIEQLEKYGIKDNEGYTYNELLRKLEAARTLDVVVKSPHADWW